jgi:hypothetical protein
MTGGVTDTYNDRFVLFFSLIERFIAPRIPIDRVVGMFAKVGTFGAGEPAGPLFSRAVARN